MPSGEETLMRLEDLSKIFFTEEMETHARAGVELEIRRRDFVAVPGPSGWGKSTLLSILGLLDAPTNGEYWLKGKPVEESMRAIRVVVMAAVLLVAITAPGLGQEELLRRRAYLGATVSPPTFERAGAEVTQVTEGSSAARGGLLAGDLILRVNGQLLDSPIAWARAHQALRGGGTAVFEVLRGNQLLELRVALDPMPKEELPGLITLYDSVLTERGQRVRTIVTRPATARGKLPGILLVSWLGCSSVERHMGRPSGTTQLLYGLARESGFAMMRVERPGLGDSEGLSCFDVDFQMELAAFRAGLRVFKQYEFVDPARIFLLGSSSGGGVAPLVAEGEKVAGYVVSGGWVKTWYEHMLEIERRRLDLLGKSPGEITAHLQGYIDFYTDFLVHKELPREILRRKPHLTPLWYELPEHMYERPAAYFWQLQDLNLQAAWEKVDVPTLVIYGTHDWIMSRADHERIAERVNQRRPGAARFVAIEGMDHSFFLHETMKQGFQDYWSGRFPEDLVPLIVDWLKQAAGQR